MMLSFLCVGPSQILDFPNSITLMVIGHTVGGFVMAFAGQPALIEMIAVGKEKYPE